MGQFSASGAKKSQELPDAESNTVVCAVCGKVCTPPGRQFRRWSRIGETLCIGCDLLMDKLEHEEQEMRNENKGVDYE